MLGGGFRAVSTVDDEMKTRFNNLPRGTKGSNPKCVRVALILVNLKCLRV